MKNFKKFLIGLWVSIILLWTEVSYAVTQENTVKQIGNLKYICIGVGIVLILLILWISYKSDKNQENMENGTEEDDDEYEYAYNNDEYIYNVEEVDEKDNTIIEEENSYELNQYNDNQDMSIENNSIYGDSTNDFQLDEIFNEEIPDMEYEQPIENYDLNADLSYVSEEEINENIQEVDMDEDFLIQMNKNLEMGDETELDNFETFSSDLEEQVISLIQNEDEPKEKSTKKSTTKKTTKKTTTKKSSEEKPKKTTAKKKESTDKTTKKATTKKTTKKTDKDEGEKKTTKKTTKKSTTKKSDEEKTKKTTRKKKEE